jgi:hypothetical protein
LCLPQHIHKLSCLSCLSCPSMFIRHPIHHVETPCIIPTRFAFLMTRNRHGRIRYR